MILHVCAQCRFGGERDGKSHCSREAVYSYLTNCIQKKALEYYLEREGRSENVAEAV
ncbi:hypothetical protein [Geothermobacter hydrogeniphilus]|uniref:hypothetical protein n=1 Tax=Geothermobacter hydrogeniphilus TaxID=1969733 RepID=UPI001304FF84|nr:hypothetical protein [Geothermobacter hydrogeniphilus]